MALKNVSLDSEQFDYQYFHRNNVCRLCWSTNGAVKLSSCSPKSVTKEVTIAAMILDHVGIDVTVSRHPSKICMDCLEKIDNFDEFKTFCHESHNKLIEILEKVTTNDSKEEFNVEIDDIDSNVFEGVTCSLNENVYNSVKLEREIDDDVKLLLEDDKMLLPDKVAIKREIDEALSNFSFNESDIFSETLISKDIYCYCCRIIFKSPESLTKHNLKYHKPKPSSESITKPLKRKYISLKREKASDSNFKKQKTKKNKKFPCFGCKKLYDSYVLRYAHERKHCIALSKGYKCEICDVFLPKRGKFEEHLKVHENLPFDRSKFTMTCNKCKETFVGKIALCRHYETHLETQTYICEICGKISSDRSNLYNHQLQHKALYKLKCPHCNYRTTYKYYLDEHIRTHTGERPFACNLCSYKSHSSKNVRGHKKTVHMHIKDVKCQICQKAFRDKFVLSEHVSAVHLKVKAYSCSQCGEEYILLRALRKHYFEKHGIKVRKEKDFLVQVVTDENKTYKLKIQSVQDVLVKDNLNQCNDLDSQAKDSKPDDSNGDSNHSGDSNKADGSDSAEFKIPDDMDTLG